jgi:hypothetical protein
VGDGTSEGTSESEPEKQTNRRLISHQYHTNHKPPSHSERKKSTTNAPRVKVDTGRVGGSGVLDDLLTILELVVSLVTDLLGQSLSLDLELLGLGLSLSGSVVDLLTDGGSEEGGREEWVGVVSSGSHFGKSGVCVKVSEYEIQWEMS